MKPRRLEYSLDPKENQEVNRMPFDLEAALEQDAEPTREEEKLPTILYYGSPKKFARFRIKGEKGKRLRKKENPDIKVQGRACVYLHGDRDVVERKYSQPQNGKPAYLYDIRVDKAKLYADAIRDERLKKKSKALTENVWITLPRYCTVLKIVEVNDDGTSEVIFEREGDKYRK